MKCLLNKLIECLKYIDQTLEMFYPQDTHNIFTCINHLNHLTKLKYMSERFLVSCKKGWHLGFPRQDGHLLLTAVITTFFYFHFFCRKSRGKPSGEITTVNMTFSRNAMSMNASLLGHKISVGVVLQIFFQLWYIAGKKLPFTAVNY